MGTGLHHRISARSAGRKGQALAISSFTLFLLGFALFYWIFHMFTVVTATQCEYGIVWISGWFDYRAPFQWLGAAIVLCMFVWLLRLVAIRNLNKGETAFQLILILGLAAAFLAQKAFLFPYGTPSAAQVDRIVQILIPQDPRLEEERSTFFDYAKDWKFDYPPPPFAERPEPAEWDEGSFPQLTDIFQDTRSPLYSEYKRLHACHADYLAAVAEYEQNIETWNEYWEDFDIWYAGNRWRYPDQPRPYWW